MTSVLALGGARAGDAAPLRIYAAGFAVRRIGQTTMYPGAANALRVTLVPSVDFSSASGAALTISGLLGSRTDSTPAMVLQDLSPAEGSSLAALAPMGAWNRLAGSLTVALASGTLAAGTLYTFEWVLDNPYAYRPAPAYVRIAVSTSGLSVPAVAMELDTTSVLAVAGAVAGDAAPLRVQAPGLALAAIGQSTCVAGAANTITLTLAANVDLTSAAGTTVTVTGLLGAQTEDSARVLLAGGFDSTTFMADVYETADGVNFTQLTADGGFTPREALVLIASHPAVGAAGGLFIVAGRSVGAGGLRLLNDVWRSDDGGANWIQVGAQACASSMVLYSSARRSCALVQQH